MCNAVCRSCSLAPSLQYTIIATLWVIASAQPSGVIKTYLVICAIGHNHLINGRHAMTAIGTSKTQQGQGGGGSKHGRYSIPRNLIVELLNQSSP